MEVMIGVSCVDKNTKWTIHVQKESDRVKLHQINSKVVSIVNCSVNCEWDISQERNMTFYLRNHNYRQRQLKVEVKVEVDVWVDVKVM